MASPDQVSDSVAGTNSRPLARSTRAGRIKLVLLFLVFAAPVIASYLTYYVFPPSGRTNYGELIEPQRPIGSTTFSRAGADYTGVSLVNVQLGDITAKTDHAVSFLPLVTALENFHALETL